ncbi:hypothetical protein E4U42_004064 [Claviceps africana]|uniref:C2H2-type domain-containing protein n=1 Tax=Claviceps africana TaxID=83212 RepID=A0A8K0NL31_9HYPO|nr:hypothetical protein E4U42_004064 [Claviceps africana]
MASSYVQAPVFSQGRDSASRETQVSNAAHQRQPALSHLSAGAALSFPLDEVRYTDAGSLAVDIFETPSASGATPSHYPSSDFSDLDDDPFYGVSFDGIDPVTPFFLEDAAIWHQTEFPCNSPSSSVPEPQHEANFSISCPLTPAHTASLDAASPKSDRKDVGTVEAPDTLPKSISPQKLEKTYKPAPVAGSASAMTSSLSSNNHTSQDGLDPVSVPMRPQNLRVIVVNWDKDGGASVDAVERSPEYSPASVRAEAYAITTDAGDLISTAAEAHDNGLVAAHPDALDAWSGETGSKRAGLDSLHRPAGEVSSINDVAKQQAIDERNEQVARWRSHSVHDVAAPTVETSPEEMQGLESPRDDDNDIPLGHGTENRYIPGRTYFEGPGGEISDIDREILASCRNWADAPVIPGIISGEYGKQQPETSHAAMARFQSMCRDNDSVISRSATWGTRRRSLPSVIDAEGVTSGNFLKRLSIGRGNGEKTSRPGSFLRDLRGLVRRASVSSQLRKRSRSRSCSRSVSGEAEAAMERKDTTEGNIGCESTPHLSPHLGSMSNGKKTTPSINTTLASMGQNIASIWTGHSRSGSLSGISTTMASPRASLGSLAAKSPMRRPRSKSEIPKDSKSGAGMETVSSIAELWSKTGGPPVAPVSRVNLSHAASTAAVDDEDDEDDEDDDEEEEVHEENGPRLNSIVIGGFPPSFAGFQQHIMLLNPGLRTSHGYLVDRIAHHQMERYKQLLTVKARHMGQGADCACGTLCMALGGSAVLLDQKGHPRGLDSLTPGMEDNEWMLTDGAIHQKSFPRDIPMPPTHYLPAEFECQLCFQKKRFRKPSDWTKHVHEDVQPFTCTWDRCRDTIMFKRKADWVRHENEGHRHLEWWTCDVDECRHTCYRRDNFLQHLVREHKFPELKVKTKAAMKRGGEMGPTWQRAEQCHAVTTARPQDEACRFCGKVLPTWKKLTVHLAEHMQRISLPILRLVAARDSSADSVISSPVEDAAPRRQVPLGPPNPSTPLPCIPWTQLSVESAPGQGGAQEGAQAQQKLLGHGCDGPRGACFPTPSPIVSAAVDLASYEQYLMDRPCDGLQQQPNAMADATKPFPYMGAYLDSSSSSSSSSPFGCTSASSDDMEPFPRFGLDARVLRRVEDATMGAQLSGHMTRDGMMMNASCVNGGAFGNGELLSTHSLAPHLYASSRPRGQQPQQQRQPPWDDGGFLSRCA